MTNVDCSLKINIYMTSFEWLNSTKTARESSAVWPSTSSLGCLCHLQRLVASQLSRQQWRPYMEAGQPALGTVTKFVSREKLV